MSSASRAPLIYIGLVTRPRKGPPWAGAKTAATQLDEFVRQPAFLGKARSVRREA